MTDQNILLQESGYPNAPDIKARLRDLNSSTVGATIFRDALTNIEQLERELAEARKGRDRYEYIRTLNVPQFTALKKANIRGHGRFDDLVDDAMKDKP